MSVVDLIRDEIMERYPSRRPTLEIRNDNYSMVCSPVFYRHFIDSFLQAGTHIYGEKDIRAELLQGTAVFSSFVIPNVGNLKIRPSIDEQGYKIEKI